MIKEEDYLKAKQIVQEYEKQLNISDVKKRIIIDANKVIRVKPRMVKQGLGSLFC